MPTLGKIINSVQGLNMAEQLTRSINPNTAYERIKRSIDPNWNRQANQYAEPIHLLREHLGLNWKPGLHFDVMNEHFMRLVRRVITSLIVTMPPQHGKSTFGSVVLPAWYLGDYPTHQIIGTAYNTSHAAEFSSWARDIVRDKGEQLGLHLDRMHRGSTSWGVLEGGVMRAAGIDAGITGKPCHFLLGDDPIKKPSEAFSPAYKKRIRTNWTQACETRLQPDGIRLLTMTRWAFDDLVGWLLENQPGDWEVLHLEAICRSNDDPLGRKRGEALWEHYPIEHLKKIRRRIGAYAFMTMYQGKPQRRPPDHEPFIEYELLERAAARDFAHTDAGNDHRKLARRLYWQEQPLDIGVDVARSPKGDRLTFIGTRGNKMVIRIVKRGQATTKTANQIVAMICEHGPRSVRIDDDGVGGGVVDRVWEIIDNATAEDFSEIELVRLKSVEIIDFRFGAPAYNSKEYADCRTEAYWWVRELLRDDKLDLPEDQELFDDLTAPSMGFSSNGRNKLESKEAMKRERGVPSTDLSDGLVMALYPWEWINR